VVQSERAINLLADFEAGVLRVDNPESSGEQTLRPVGPDGKPGPAIHVAVGKSRIELPKAAIPMPRLFASMESRAATVESAKETPDRAAAVWPVDDRTAQWREAWHYSALQQPMEVKPARRLPGGVVDLGRVVNLAEIDLAPPSRGRSLPEPLP